jgi:hypothetical protein
MITSSFLVQFHKSLTSGERNCLKIEQKMFEEMACLEEMFCVMLFCNQTSLNVLTLPAAVAQLGPVS